MKLKNCILKSLGRNGVVRSACDSASVGSSHQGCNKSLVVSTGAESEDISDEGAGSQLNSASSPPGAH